MFHVRNVADESDYKKMLQMESMIDKAEPDCWHWHFGGIGFDRYFFGEDNREVYDYGKLVFMDDQCIGYALVDLEANQWIFSVLTDYRSQVNEIIPIIETYFPSGTSVETEHNEESVIHRLYELGYEKIEECTFTGVLDLSMYEKVPVQWDQDQIRFLEERDTLERAKYSGLPTGGATITKLRVEQYMNTEDYQSTLDFVVVDKGKQNLKGYYSWWIDVNSNTAMLNPVACIEEYRRQGISRRAILHGLNELKDRGIDYAYVDTSIGNEKAIALYEGVGFKKCKKVFRLTKTI